MIDLTPITHVAEHLLVIVATAWVLCTCLIVACYALGLRFKR